MIIIFRTVGRKGEEGKIRLRHEDLPCSRVELAMFNVNYERSALKYQQLEPNERKKGKKKVSIDIILVVERKFLFRY
jgi:hypothetical protein